RGAYGRGMSSVLMVSLLAVFVAVLVLFSYAVVVEGWRIFRSDSRLRLLEAIRGQRLPEPALDSERAARNAARATQRCLSCASQARCDKVLATRDWKALREICPNTAYIDSLRGPEC
ncbi:MAG TPA: DUF6455 family protein, partial [Burkholderiales bacterium]